MGPRETSQHMTPMFSTVERIDGDNLALTFRRPIGENDFRYAIPVHIGHYRRTGATKTPLLSRTPPGLCWRSHCNYFVIRAFEDDGWFCPRARKSCNQGPRLASACWLLSHAHFFDLDHM